jgi:Cysteine-rich secretory protein family
VADKRKPVLLPLLVTVIVISSSLVLGPYVKDITYSSNSLQTIKSEYVQSGQKPEFTINNDLVQYALKKINEDRIKFNLPPVELSQNKAAQIHAEDLFKTKYPHPSHWTTDGMKPYMKYSTYNGTAYVEQNVAISGYDNATIEKCKSGTFHCDKLNPYTEINDAQWKMVYNDTACCNDSHKNNILDKYHTHVSLGIVYDEYYFAFVQNFENNYIQFNKPLTQDNRHIQISGIQLKNNNMLDSIGVYYDDLPSQIIYEDNKDKSSYELGKFIASVVKPPPLLFHYKQPSNYTLIQADKWSQKDQTLDVSFDLSSILSKKGVYTIVIYFTDNNKNRFPATSYSIFF